jgi:hypothetical protein
MFFIFVFIVWLLWKIVFGLATIIFELAALLIGWIVDQFEHDSDPRASHAR